MSPFSRFMVGTGLLISTMSASGGSMIRMVGGSDMYCLCCGFLAEVVATTLGIPIILHHFFQGKMFLQGHSGPVPVPLSPYPHGICQGIGWPFW